MNECGVSCAKPVFKPLHKYFEASPQKLRAKRDDFQNLDTPGEFPNAKRAMKRAVSIPIYPSLNDEELERVCEAVEVVWTGGAFYSAKNVR